MLETIALFVLLAVVGLRPLIGETYDSAGSPFTYPGGGLADPSPVRTLVIDCVILAAAGLWLAARAIGPRVRYRRTGLEYGFIVVAIAAAVSCFFAGNQRLAVNASVDWLAMPVLAVTLTQLVRRPWQVRLTLCVILASAAANAGQCLYQKLVSFEETSRDYYEHRVDIWAHQGVALDSPQVEAFERRLAAQEASGYTWHSNVAGAYLVLAAFAGLGLAVGKWCNSAASAGYGTPAKADTRVGKRGRADTAGAVGRAAAKPAGPPFRQIFAVATGLLAFGVLAVTVTTGSLGAFLAIGAVAVLGAAVELLGRWIRRHRRLAFGLGWSCAVGAVAAVVTHGVVRGSLPGASLSFRWQYWTASVRMIADHPLTGVGMENFGRHYVRYKPIESPEEVKNPHNFLVSAAADWGLPGLAGVVLMLVGGSWVLSRPTPYDARSPGFPDESGGPMSPTGRPWVWGLLLILGIFGPRVFLLESDLFYYRVWSTVFPLLFWACAFSVAALETNIFTQFQDEPLPRLPLMLNCGLLAFLISDLVNFSLLVPSTLTTFFALMGVAAAVRAPVEPAGVCKRSVRWLPAVLCFVGLVLLVGFVVRPVARARVHLADARRQLPMDPALDLAQQPTYQSYAQAAEADVLDPTAPAELARFAIAYAEMAGGRRSALTAAVARLESALDRDPLWLRLWRDLVHARTALAEAAADPAAYVQAVAAAQRVVELYPTSPDDYERLGDAYASVLIEPESPVRDARECAIEAYEHALALDDARPEWEVVQRFSVRKREAIQEKVDKLRQAASTRPD
ncbi:MAG: O-antigen ligase family protein [Phycisphaerae bacterium]|nr:O-antigen ligase family protein [Phycisphaerae bacterium]